MQITMLRTTLNFELANGPILHDSNREDDPYSSGFNHKASYRSHHNQAPIADENLPLNWLYNDQWTYRACV